MKLKLYCILLFCLVSISTLIAQTNDFGIWSSIGAETKIGKWDFGTSTELRTMDNSGHINRWSLQLESAFTISKHLKTGISYQFIYYNDTKYSDYQPRNRFAFYIQGKQKLGNFTFNLRERVQITTKDESDRLKKSGAINTYKINPEWYWRNRLKMAYNIPKFPVTPSLSFESFYQLNNPNGNTFDKLRFTLAFNYKISKHNKLEFYGLMNYEINVTSLVNNFVTGVNYTYSF